MAVDRSACRGRPGRVSRAARAVARSRGPVLVQKRSPGSRDGGRGARTREALRGPGGGGGAAAPGGPAVTGGFEYGAVRAGEPRRGAASADELPVQIRSAA